MAEWHLTPEYINRHWTEELLLLMFLKRNVRYNRIKQAIASPASRPLVEYKNVGDDDFISRNNIPYRRV